MGVSIGMVGLGAFGSGFVELFKNHPAVDRIALCDREADRIATFAERDDFADKFDAKDAYASLEDICRSDIEALVLITQHWLHGWQAIEALRAGKHVYAAVPLLSVPDADEILDCCDQLIAAVRETGRHFMFGETTYYRPETQYARRKAAEGAFGDFVYGEGEYMHDFNSGRYTLQQVRAHRLASTAGQEWARKLQSYWDRGIINGPMHYPTHSTAGPISVMGAHPTRVWALPYRDRTDEAFFAHELANETALFEMSNGAAMRICEYRQIAARGRESFRVYGTEGSFEDGQLHRRGGAAEEPTVEQMREPLPKEVAAAWQAAGGEEKDFYGGHGGSHAYLVHEFVDALAHDRMPAVNAWEAVRYMAAGAVAHKSALAGGAVLDVPDWGDAPAHPGA